MRSVTWLWTSDANGDVGGTSTSLISGMVYRWTTLPSSIDAPTDLYDVVVQDPDGIDISSGGLSSRSSSVGQQVKETPPVAVDSPLELKVSGAGALKAGTLRMFFR